MAKRIFTVFFVSILSLGYLSVGLLPSGERRLASCADPLAETNFFPLSSGLFGEIKGEALRKSTMDYYLFLSKVEMQALVGRQTVRAMYGLSDSAPVSALPTITPFDPKGNTFATGFLWGRFENPQTRNNFTVGRSLPGITVPPYTLGYSDKSPSTAGILFQPSSLQQITSQQQFASPTSGVFFPSVNSANHKIGTF